MCGCACRCKKKRRKERKIPTVCNTPFISLKLCVCVGVGVLLICEYVGVGVFKGVWVSVWMCHTCVGVRVGVKKRARREHTSKITHIGHCIAAPAIRLDSFIFGNWLKTGSLSSVSPCGAVGLSLSLSCFPPVAEMR